MAITVYDLCTADDAVRLSPPCWTVKLALKHKGLAFETAPMGFTNKQDYPDPDYGRLPQITDGETLVVDSDKIIDYLEKTYPDKPLYRGDGSRTIDRTLRAFAGAYLFPLLAPKLFLRIHDAARQADQAYFRVSREERLKMTLEEAAARDVSADLEKALGVIAAPLAASKWYAGDTPGLPDYSIASIFLWERSVGGEPVMKKPEALAAWFERVLDLYDGYARNAPAA